MTDHYYQIEKSGRCAQHNLRKGYCAPDTLPGTDYLIATNHKTGVSIDENARFLTWAQLRTLLALKEANESESIS
jgi:hypothetical protein